MPSKKPKPKKKPRKFQVKLRDTFFNRNLLEVKPFELREELFVGHSRKDAWLVVVNLLTALEQGVKKILAENPLPFDVTSVLSLNESEFQNSIIAQSLTDEQANAMAALRSVAIIRREFDLVEVHPGQHVHLDLLDEDFEHSYEPATVATIALEMALLIMAAFRGDFWTNIWPHVRRGAILKASTGLPRKREEDNLHKEIVRNLKKYGLNRSTKEIMKSLLKDSISEHDSCISSFTKRAVKWFDDKHDEPRTTSIKTLQNRISKIKSDLCKIPAS